MKKYGWFALLTALMLLMSLAAQAEILPPHGEGQIGLQAVVLCEELTLRHEPRAASQALATLQYGDLPIVIHQENGWAYCVLGDSEDSPAGWLNADYIAVDPAWYRTEAQTPVYAWSGTDALKVALLDKDETLPILKQDGPWLLVSLRGAAGWILMPTEKK